MTACTTSELVASESAPPPRGPWLFWGTTLWGLAIVATLVIVPAVGSFAAFVWLDPDPALSEHQLLELLYSHQALVFALIGGSVASASAVLALAVRLSRIGAWDYLGLVRPRGFDIMIGLAGLVFLYGCFVLASHFLGPQPSPSFVGKLYQSAQLSGSLALLAAALIVLIPAGEELLIRGFLLRGWAASRIGPTWAILLTTAIWTSAHTQYDLRNLVYIFCLGLLLGWLRQRSGSTLLTILLHAIQNAAALVQVAIYYWLGLAL